VNTALVGGAPFCGGAGGDLFSRSLSVTSGGVSEMAQSAGTAGGRLRRALTGTRRVVAASATAKKAAPARPAAPPAKTAAPAAKKPAPAAKKVAPPVKKAAPPVTRPPGRLAVRADERPWTATELAAVRAELQHEVSRLRAEIAEAEQDLADLLRDSGEGAGDDQADAGTKTFEREHEMSLANNSRDMLLQAERALQRIADGSYGVCEVCGNPIGKARLQAFPRATLCLSCKQLEERR